MRILTWNCNGAFRKKYKALESFDADVLIIQECENPELSSDPDYKKFSENSFWKGENKNKGLGVFARDNISLVKNDWPDDGLQYFISCSINDNFNLLGVWCHGATFPDYNYIGQFWKYLQLNRNRMDNILITGDFNSNKIWDKSGRCWNHSNVVMELTEIGIKSFYHELNNIEQGNEQIPTFLLQKHNGKPYHIDYMFGSNEILTNVLSFRIESFDKWITVSDHVPIICDIKEDILKYDN